MIGGGKKKEEGEGGEENVMKEFSCTPATDISEPVASLTFSHPLG
jgi:hypothetical protein